MNSTMRREDETIPNYYIRVGPIIRGYEEVLSVRLGRSNNQWFMKVYVHKDNMIDALQASFPDIYVIKGFLICYRTPE